MEALGTLRVGERIKLARLAAGKTNAAQLARDAGIQPHTLWRYENGRTRPGIAAVVAIARECGVTVDWLLTGHEGVHAQKVRRPTNKAVGVR